MMQLRCLWAASVMMIATSVAVAGEGAASAPEAAAAAADGQSLEPVEIVGLKNAARVGYARLLRGVAAFDRRHAYAPSAELRFDLIDRATGRRDPVVVQLEMGDHLLPLAIDAAQRFVLPTREVAGPGDGELVSNRRAGELRVYPSVRSPGTSDGKRRLGDLRAECDTLWAIYRDDLNFFMRNAAEAVGGVCHHANISVNMPVSRKLASADLSAGDRSLKLAVVTGGLSFTPPMHDLSWPDDAVVTLVFE